MKVIADVERMVPMAIERYPGGLTLGMLEEARFGALLVVVGHDRLGLFHLLAGLFGSLVGLGLLAAHYECRYQDQ